MITDNILIQDQPFVFSFRFVVIALLAVFMVVTLFGFSMTLELKPAQAFSWSVVFDPSVWGGLGIQTWKDVFWDFTKATAIIFTMNVAQQILNGFIVKFEKKLTISNFLYYSDSLFSNQYFSDSVNKALGIIPEGGETAKLSAAEIIQDFNAKPFTNFPTSGVKALALASLPASTDSITFTADRTNISDGQDVKLSWSVSGKNVAVKLDNQNVQLRGSSTRRLTQSTTFTLWTVHAYSNQPLGSSRQVKIVVNKEPAPSGVTIPASNPGAISGLTREQEALLLRGTLTSLTTRGGCAANSAGGIRNMAVYNASKSLGFEPYRLDPQSSTFYFDLAKAGSPQASSAYQELALRDSASYFESRANQAVNQELVSSGLKAQRSPTVKFIQNARISLSQRMESFLHGKMFSIFGTVNNPNSVAVILGQTFGAILSSVVSQEILNGSVLAEEIACGRNFSGAGTGAITPPSFTGNPLLPEDALKNLTFHFAENNSKFIQVNSGEEVTLVWNAGSVQAAFINGSQVPLSGSRKETITGPVTFDLTIEHEILGSHNVASAQADIIPPEEQGNNNNEEEQNPSITSFGAVPNLINPGENVTLSWGIANPNNLCQVQLQDQAGGIIGSSTSCASGSAVVSPGPSQTTTYRLFLKKTASSAAIWDSAQATVAVSSNQEGAGVILSQPFKIRY